MLILQQSRNTALSIKIQAAQSHAKPIDTPKLTTGHFIALQREEIQFTHQNIDASSSNQSGKLDKPLDQTSPTGSKLHKTEESQTYSLQKGQPKYSNLNKI